MIWRILKVFLVVLVLGSLLTFILMMDYQAVISQIRKVGFGFIWILILSFLSYLSGSVAWYFCFNNSERLSFYKLFFIRTIGENVSLFNPTNIIGGEATKYMLLESMNLSKNDKLDSILISRFLLILSQLIIALFCLLWILYKMEYVIIGSIFICATGFLIWITYLVFSKMDLKRWLFEGFNIQWLRGLKNRGEESMKRIFHFGETQTFKGFKALGCSTLHWIFGAFEIFVILSLLGVMPHLMDCITVDTGVVLLKSIGGFIPGQIGVEEIANKWMLTLVGVQGASIWLSVSIIRRAKQLFWAVFSVTVYFVISKIKKSNLDGNLIYNT